MREKNLIFYTKYSLYYKSVCFAFSSLSPDIQIMRMQHRTILRILVCCECVRWCMLFSVSTFFLPVCCIDFGRKWYAHVLGFVFLRTTIESTWIKMAAFCSSTSQLLFRNVILKIFQSKFNKNAWQKENRKQGNTSKWSWFVNGLTFFFGVSHCTIFQSGHFFALRSVALTMHTLPYASIWRRNSLYHWSDGNASVHIQLSWFALNWQFVYCVYCVRYSYTHFQYVESTCEYMQTAQHFNALIYLFKDYGLLLLLLREYVHIGVYVCVWALASFFLVWFWNAILYIHYQPLNNSFHYMKNKLKLWFDIRGKHTSRRSSR